MRQIFKIIFLYMQFGFITACATMNDHFDCPNKAGVSCKSLDQINDMVDNGRIRGRAQQADGDVKNSKTYSSHAEFSTFPALHSLQESKPIRHGETIQRIWIAPFEDEEGNYHSDSLMYTVMRSGYWSHNLTKSVDTL